jgi:hypothetical protein
VQVVVLLHEGLELRLHVRHLALRELVLVEWDPGVLEVPQEPELFWQEKEKRPAHPRLSARCPPNTVNVLVGLVWGVVLNNPVDRWDVEPPCSHVGAQHDSTLSVAKLEKCFCALGLLLSSVNVEAGDVDVVEKFTVVLDRVARAEEDHDFLLQVSLEKRKEKQEPLVRRAHDVPAGVWLWLCVRVRVSE